VNVSTYFRKTFHGPDESINNTDVLFRTINGQEYIESFRSDRSHMRLPSGDWAAPPPAWPPIVTNEISNLIEWLDIKSDGPGKILSLEQIIEFYSFPKNS
jgi:hypothetical protein